MKKYICFHLFIFGFTLLTGQSAVEIKPDKVLKKHTAGVTALAYSPDGQTLVSGSDDKTLLLWNTSTWEAGKPLTGHTNAIRSICYSEKGTRFYSGGDYFIRSWTTAGKPLEAYRGPTTYIWSIALKSDSSQMVSGSFEKNLKLYDLKTGKVTNIPGHTKSAMAVAYSPDGKILASGSLDQSIFLWDTKNYKIADTLKGHGGNIYCVTFSPDGKYLASTSNDNTIRIWEVATGKMIRNLQGHTKGVTTAAFSPDGNYLVSGSADTRLIIWELCNGEPLADISYHMDIVNQVAFHPAGTSFASASGDKSIAIWSFSHQIIVNHYFTKEIKQERDQSGLFAIKGKDENKTDYQARLLKANEFDKQLVEKYYLLYSSQIKGVWK